MALSFVYQSQYMGPGEQTLIRKICHHLQNKADVSYHVTTILYEGRVQVNTA